jgi:hypothetical protein
MKHETLLTYFDSGWKALSPMIQSLWLPSQPAPVLPRSVRVKSYRDVTEWRNYTDHHYRAIDADLFLGSFFNSLRERVDNSAWASWIDFPLEGIPELKWDCDEAVEYLAANMERTESLLGVGKPPETHRIRRSKNVEEKSELAEKLLYNYMEKIKAAAWEDLKARIEEEGEAALRLLL